MSNHLDRILREAGEGELMEALVVRLAPTDLQTLLLEVYLRKAAMQTPARALRQYRESRFVRPSPLDPLVLLEFDRFAFAAAKGFERLELAPLCPLGTTSVVSNVSQNNVVSTSRNSEVMADLTNVLAMECALRRSGAETVKLCASHRVTRAQFFDQPNSWAHFKLFGLCTAGRDRGGYDFEVEALTEHLDFYIRFLGVLRSAGFGIGAIRIGVTDFSGLRSDRLRLGVLDVLAGRYPEITIAPLPDRETGRTYYDAVCFHVYVSDAEGNEYFLADGGFTDWTQQFLANKKERLLISGIGSERLCSVFAPPA